MDTPSPFLKKGLFVLLVLGMALGWRSWGFLTRNFLKTERMIFLNADNGNGSGRPGVSKILTINGVTASKEISEILLGVSLPEKSHFTKGDRIEFSFSSMSSYIEIFPKQGVLEDPSEKLPLRLKIRALGGSADEIRGHLSVPFCTEGPPKLCKMKEIELVIPVTISD